MGQYLTPENPSDYVTKCAVIFYPSDNGAFYLDAVRGQLSELCRPYIWEGDRSKQDEIAQIWLDHDQLTSGAFFAISCDDVPLITGDETLNVNVNVDCNHGGGCCGGDIINITPPGYQNPAEGETLAPGDFVDDLVSYPPGFNDRAEYDSYKCQMAGQMAKDFAITIESMQSLSGLATAGSLILMQALFTTAALSKVIVGLMAIGMSFGGAVILIVAALVTLATAGLGLFSYFSLVSVELLNNLDSLRCALYNAKTEAEAKQAFVDATSEAVAVAAVGSLENGDVFTSVLFGLVDALLPDELLSALFGAVQALVDGDVTYDCTACNQIDTPVYATYNARYTQVSGPSDLLAGEAIVGGVPYVLQSIDPTDQTNQTIYLQLRLTTGSGTLTTLRSVWSDLSGGYVPRPPGATGTAYKSQFKDGAGVAIIQQAHDGAAPTMPIDVTMRDGGVEGDVSGVYTVQVVFYPA